MKFSYAPPWSILPIYILFTVFSILLVYIIGIDLVSNDGAQYLSTARNFISGNGLSTSVLYYDQHFQSGKLPAPQAMWPPAYPLFVSFVALFTDRVDLVTIVINIVLHGISGWLLYGLVLRTGASHRTAVVSLVVYFLVAQGWVNALEVRTESLFVVVSIAVLRFLPTTSEGSSLSWFLIGAGTGLATVTRYVGIVELLAVLAMLLTMGLTHLVRGNRQYFFKTAINGIAATLGACLFIIPTLVRNYLISGSISPRSGLDEALTLLATLDNFVYATAGLLGFSAHGSLPNAVRYLVFIVLLVSLFAFISIQCLKYGKRSRPNTVVQLSLWCSVLSMGLFVWSGLTSSPTNLNVRYLYSWMLLSIPAFVWLVATGHARNHRLTTTVVERAHYHLSILILSIFVFGQVDFLFSKRHQLEDIAYLKNSIETETTNGLTVGVQASQCAENGGSLLTNRSQQLHRLLQVPTIGMAKSHYTSIRFDTQYLVDVVDRYRVSIVVLYTKKFAARVNSEEEEQRLTQIIRKLTETESFQKVHDNGSTYVFKNTTLCPATT